MGQGLVVTSHLQLHQSRSDYGVLNDAITATVGPSQARPTQRQNLVELLGPKIRQSEGTTNRFCAFFKSALPIQLGGELHVRLH
jgi:hypothetical protein